VKQNLATIKSISYFIELFFTLLSSISYSFLLLKHMFYIHVGQTDSSELTLPFNSYIFLTKVVHLLIYKIMYVSVNYCTKRSR